MVLNVSHAKRQVLSLKEHVSFAKTCVLSFQDKCLLQTQVCSLLDTCNIFYITLFYSLCSNLPLGSSSPFQWINKSTCEITLEVANEIF